MHRNLSFAQVVSHVAKRPESDSILVDSIGGNVGIAALSLTRRHRATLARC